MKAAKLMLAYAGFLIVCGVTAYFMAPPAANATTALLVPCIAAGLMLVFGAMAWQFPHNRMLGMVGIHVGLALPLLFGFAFGYRAYKTFASGDEDRRYLAVILTIMAIASVIAFIAILLQRPPQSART